MRLLSCLALLLFAIHARAVTLCATNASELQTQLTAAQNDGQDDEIRLETNNYDAPANGFTFFPQDDGAITLSGGWTTFSGTPCGRRITNDPIYTQLNGNGTSRVLSIAATDLTNVHIELITFVGGDTTGSPYGGGGAGLKITVSVNYQGTVSIERNIFKNNVSDSGSGAVDVYGGNELIVLNNLFINNQPGCNCGAGYLGGFGGSATYVVGNTVTNNLVGSNCTSNLPIDGGLCVLSGGPVLLADNILWGNSTTDLHVSDGNVTLIANDYGSILGTPAGASSGNFQLDPQFAITPEYRLSNRSPLIDKGVMPQQADPWQLSSYDLDGHVRVVGSSVDLGAFENADEIFFDEFE